MTPDFNMPGEKELLKLVDCLLNISCSGIFSFILQVFPKNI
jgi:hypothetical protein